MPISFFIKSSDALLNCAMWTPAKSRDEAIVFCHGWGGGTPYDDLLRKLSERGYTVLRFEQRGYGASTGHADLSMWPVDMATCAAALTQLVKKVWAMGHSPMATRVAYLARTK